MDIFIHNNYVIMKPNKTDSNSLGLSNSLCIMKITKLLQKKKIFLQLDGLDHDPNKYHLLNLVKSLILF